MISRIVQLSEIAHGRSGDKGNHSNIAIIAYNQCGFDWLREYMTAEVVKAYFEPLNPKSVERFEARNLLAFNFFLREILAGGASQSLRIDTQGKSYALALLQMPIPLSPDSKAIRKKEDMPP